MHVWGTVAGPGPEGRVSRAGPRSGPAGRRRDSPHPLCGEGEADVRPTQNGTTGRSARITESSRVKAGTRSGQKGAKRKGAHQA